MDKKNVKPSLTAEGKNPPLIKPGSIRPPQNKTGYNSPPVGERPVKPVITPPPPKKKNK